MEGLFQPSHLIFIIIMVGILILPKLIKSIRRSLSERAAPEPATKMKYCADCGKQILRRAEICPYCGCWQLPPP